MPKEIVTQEQETKKIGEPPFSYFEYIKEIQTVKPEEEFICRFIRLNYWRTPRDGGKFEPYYQVLEGVQIKNKLYYINPFGEEKYVYIRKTGNEILQIFDEIPADTPNHLVQLYLKTGKKLKLAEIYKAESEKYYKKHSNGNETETV